MSVDRQNYDGLVSAMAKTDIKEPTYAEAFPPLPMNTAESEPFPPITASMPGANQWNKKMSLKSSITTQVFTVPLEERRFKEMLEKPQFGEKGHEQVYNKIKGFGVTLEMSHSKDQTLTVMISGKPDAVLKARKKLLEELQKPSQAIIHIPKEHHRFILGLKGKNLEKLELQTATRITIPRPNEDSDVITIAGPKDGIEKAKHELQMISDEQAKLAFEKLAIPRVYHPFIAGPDNKLVRDMMEETGARITVPPHIVEKDEIVISGEKDGVLRAKQSILRIYEEKKLKTTTVSVEVKKSQHRYIIGSKGSGLSEILAETGVSVEVPPSDNSSETITLRGDPENLGPALTLVYSKANSIVIQEVHAPVWLHRFIMRRQKANFRHITQEYPRVHMECTDEQDNIRLEGPPDDVEQAKNQLEMIVKDLIARMAYVDLNVDPKYHKHIIGRNGANVSRMKTEHEVEVRIQPDSDVIRIEGVSEGVARAKQELLDLVEKMENEKSRDILIDHRFHRQIIGSQGGKIREIRERFPNVMIGVPEASRKSDVITLRGPKNDVDKCYLYLQKLYQEMVQIEEITIDIPHALHNLLLGKGGQLIRSVKDECGGVLIRFPSSGTTSDKVVIRGPTDDVAKAKKLLLELASEKKDSLCTTELRVKPEYHRFLIGRNGVNIRDLNEKTGARVVFPNSQEQSDPELITIIGRQEGIERAKAELQSRLRDLENIVEIEMKVDSKHHRYFVSRKGEILKQIADEFGGVVISFPRIGVKSDLVVLKGARNCVEGAKKRVEEIVHDLDNRTTIECVIPHKHHGLVMGSKGRRVQDLTQEFNVNIQFPERRASPDVPAEDSNLNGSEENGASSKDRTLQSKQDIVTISGSVENCERARAALLALLPVTEEMSISFDLHRYIIGQKGRDVRKMMEDCDVSISIPPAEGKSDIIRITGPQANVERAKEALLDRVQQLEDEKEQRALKSYQLEVMVPAKYHPKIIGKRGAVITKIRNEHDVQIQFPDKANEGSSDSILIVGLQENAEMARDDILKIVKDLEDLISEEIEIDHRIHSRLIGFHGRGIRKIMENFKVDVRFPGRESDNPDLVVITGQEDNVLECKDDLLNRAEELMQEIFDSEIADQYQRPQQPLIDSEQSGNQVVEGFTVVGAPWSAPNTASLDDFPDLPLAAAQPTNPIKWGPIPSGRH